MTSNCSREELLFRLDVVEKEKENLIAQLTTEREKVRSTYTCTYRWPYFRSES